MTPSDIDDARKRHFTLRGNALSPAENPGVVPGPTPGATPDQLHSAHLAAQTHLLSRLVHADRKRAVPFLFRAWTQSGPNRMTACNRGVVKMVSNPTAAAFQVALGQDGNMETVIFNMLLQPYTAFGIYLPFWAPLYVMTGNGAVVTGDSFD